MGEIFPDWKPRQGEKGSKSLTGAEKNKLCGVRCGAMP